MEFFMQCFDYMQKRCDVSECVSDIPSFITAGNILSQHFFATRHLKDSEFPFRVITAKKQIHSADVYYINDSNCNEDFFCDGFVINNSSFDNNKKENLGIGIRTADCVPILFSDEKNGVYGAAHSGWRGTVGTPSNGSWLGIPGIAAETVHMMLLNGAEINNINVAIGPCIHKCCFEVKDDFRQTVLDRIGVEMTEKYVIADDCCKNGEKRSYHADLIGMNVEFLLCVGICAENIRIANVCTCCNSDVFYSFRAEKNLNGVMTSAIALPDKRL